MLKTQKQWLIPALIFLFVIAAGIFVWFNYPTGTPGAKTIHAEIIAGGKTINTYELNTDAEFLRQALEEKDLIQGDENPSGLFIKTVDGITADEGNQEWWCITKGGEWVMTGIDITPIEDGDHYEITLMIGW